jgi:S-adenosylmethionine-dependent methyltransferase
MTSASVFDEGITYWLEALNEPWNRLRYTLYHANLSRHLPQGSLRILDVGGGNGGDAIPLAMQGHSVTLVDYSEKMLDEARKRAEAHDVGDNLQIHQSDLTELPILFPNPEFDVVLCHNVVQYVEDVSTTLKSVSAPLKHGGIVSVASVNRYSEAFQAALLRLDLDEASSKLDAHETFTPGFKTTVHRFAAEELFEPLNAAGCTVLGHYGVRCLMDYMYDNERKYDAEFYQKLEQLELMLTDRYPYYLIARFFQIIARKNPEM